jgi:hypothetical protein
LFGRILRAERRRDNAERPGVGLGRRVRDLSQIILLKGRR